VLAAWSAGRRFFLMTTDPVCGMSVEESEAKASTEYEGKQYFFCSDACREEFEAHPDQYAGLDEGAGASP
jgi:YHS domain-containing protein